MTLHDMTIRPAAVLSGDAARTIIDALEAADVSKGGVWNASSGLWQRYDQPWNGPIGGRGNSVVVGSVGVIYDTPRRTEITLYKATITQHGLGLGWTTERLCDEALSYAGLRLATCPRDQLSTPPASDPFEPRIPAQRSLKDLLRTDVREVLTMDVRDLFGSRR